MIRKSASLLFGKIMLKPKASGAKLRLNCTSFVFALAFASSAKGMNFAR
jgi:3-oxoacyl-[acyl-carrier-protein] synthase III